MSTPANPPQFVRRAALGLAATAPLLKSQHVTAAEGGAVAVIPAFANPPRRVPADHFTGEVQVSSPFQSHAPARANGGIVTFAPGARTAWHTHPLGQTLVVLTGAGMVQRWGDPAHHIGIGDVVWIPAWREALARCRPDRRHVAPGDQRGARRQNRGLGGTRGRIRNIRPQRTGRNDDRS